MDSEVERIKKKFKLPAIFNSSEYNVWVDFSSLSAQLKPVDLGQGFPNYLPKDFIIDTLADVTASKEISMLQQARECGHLRLVNAVSKLYSRFFDRKIDAEKEILITCGGYEALYCVIVGNVDVGDEIIIVEPFFDCYEPLVEICRGVLKFIPLRNTQTDDGPNSSSHWRLDEKELRSLFNEKTKMIVINSPLNPLGKVYDLEELTMIANLCIEFDVMCLSDEVYEWLVYKPAEHIRIASLPGMYDRTVTICSAGKSFCVTGWKCGWAYGSAQLISNAAVVHFTNTNSYITPIQEAVACCLEREAERFDSPDCWFKTVNSQLIPKRDFFVKALADAGFKPICPQGGFFIIADWTALGKKVDLSGETNKYKDINFAKWLVKNIGLLAIPPSVFYSKSKYIGIDLIRFCFFKKDETLNAAVKCLEKLKTSSF